MQLHAGHLGRQFLAGCAAGIGENLRALRRQEREHLEIRLHAGLAGAHAPPFLLRGRTDLHVALAAGPATAAGRVRLEARVNLHLQERGSLPRLCDSVLADKSDLILVHDGSHPEFVFP